MEQEFTLSIYTENKSGLLHRITVIFTRRKINIESVTISESEVKGVAKYTLMVKCDEHTIQKVTKQIEKQIDVLRANYYKADEIIYQEIALFKMPIDAFKDKDQSVEEIIRANHARILSIEPEFFVIEQTGHEEETQALFEKLEPYGILGFSRSGRVGIAKKIFNMHKYLTELEEAPASSI